MFGMSSNKVLYLWYKISRITERMEHRDDSFFAWLDCDARLTNRFSDSITRTGFVTVYPGQTQEQVFQKYKDELASSARSMGYEMMLIVTISEVEYRRQERTEQKHCKAFASSFASAPYVGKRRITK